MAHARRKYDEAKKSQPKGKSGKADVAMNFIQKLYRIEVQIKGSSADEKQQIRQQQAQPLLNEFKDWLDKSVDNIPQQTALGKAIGYSLRQWPKLIRYLDDGKLSIGRVGMWRSCLLACFHTPLIKPDVLSFNHSMRTSL